MALLVARIGNSMVVLGGQKNLGAGEATRLIQEAFETMENWCRRPKEFLAGKGVEAGLWPTLVTKHTNGSALRKKVDMHDQIVDALHDRTDNVTLEPCQVREVRELGK